MITAVAYIRVSSEEQVDGSSLEKQLHDIIAFCAANGVKLLKTFREEGKSAKDGNRPELKKMIEYVGAHRPTHLIVHKIDRFSRNQRVHHATVSALASSGTTLRSATEGISDDPAGRLLTGILAAMAEHDNDIRRERTKAGLVARAERGCWTTTPPLGYMAHRLPNGDPSLIPHPEEADYIRTAFDMAAGGRPQVQILEHLTAMGLRRRRSGKPLGSQHMSKMLRAPVYKGWLESKHIPAPIQGNWPAIVSERTWCMAHSKLNGVTARRTDSMDLFPLRGLLLCPHCHKPVTSARSKGKTKYYDYYSCHRCRETNVQAHIVHEALENTLNGIAIKPNTFKAWVELAKRYSAQALKEAKARQTKAKRILTQVENRLDALIAMRTDGEIDAETYKRNERKIEAQKIEAWELQDNANVDHGNLECALQRHKSLLLDPLGEWKVAPPERREKIAGLIWKEGPYMPVPSKETPVFLGGLKFSIWGQGVSTIETIVPAIMELRRLAA